MRPALRWATVGGVVGFLRGAAPSCGFGGNGCTDCLGDCDGGFCFQAGSWYPLGAAG